MVNTWPGNTQKVHGQQVHASKMKKYSKGPRWKIKSIQKVHDSKKNIFKRSTMKNKKYSKGPRLKKQNIQKVHGWKYKVFKRSMVEKTKYSKGPRWKLQRNKNPQKAW